MQPLKRSTTQKGNDQGNEYLKTHLKHVTAQTKISIDAYNDILFRVQLLREKVKLLRYPEEALDIVRDNAVRFKQDIEKTSCKTVMIQIITKDNIFLLFFYIQ